MKKIIYDFDNTIYDGDSTIDFYFYCLKKKKSILRYIFLQLFYFILYKIRVITKEEMKEMFFVFLKDFNNIDEIVSEFWDLNMKKIKPWYLKKNHKKDVIISASPTFLLEIPAKKLGVSDLIATDIDKTSGKFLSKNCYGEEKVARFKSKYKNTVVSESYSDSFSDLPILDLAQCGYIVKKDKLLKYKDKLNTLNKRKKIINYFSMFVFFISLNSFAILMNLICSSNTKMAIFSTIVTIICSVILFCYFQKINFLDKVKKIDNLGIKFFSLFLVVCYFFDVFNTFNNWDKLNSILYLFNYGYILLIICIFLSLYFVYNIVTFISFKLLSFFKEELKLADKKEKRFYLISLVVFSILIVIWYSLASKAVIKDDLFFSIDSNYVAKEMFPNLLWHLDFRHIFFSFLTFPFYSIFHVFDKILPLTDSHYYMFIAIFNLNLLLLTSIMIKRMLNDDKFLWFYLFSFPTIFFSIVIEKFQLCVFLIVLFIYIRTKKHENKFMEDFSLICSVGAITTSAFLGIWSNRYKILEKIKAWFIVAFKFILISIVMGKFNIISTCFDYLKTFGDLSILHRFYGVTELLSSCLFAPLFVVSKNSFLWENTAVHLNKLGLIILIVCILSFIIHRKEKLFQICFSWIIFMFILFLGLNWYCYEAPLFNLYFSWAILILVFQFIKDIFNKSVYYDRFWKMLFCIMLIVNFTLMLNLLIYLL